MEINSSVSLIKRRWVSDRYGLFSCRINQSKDWVPKSMKSHEQDALTKIKALCAGLLLFLWVEFFNFLIRNNKTSLVDFFIKAHTLQKLCCVGSPFFHRQPDVKPRKPLGYTAAFYSLTLSSNVRSWWANLSTTLCVSNFTLDSCIWFAVLHSLPDWASEAQTGFVSWASL